VIGNSTSRPARARGNVDRRFTPVYAVAFSPDGRRLATASGDGVVRLWDVTDPAVPTRLWAVPTRFAAGPVVAFSPDGAWLATGHDTANAVLWEISERAGPIPRALLPHPGGLTGLHFSADGRRLAATFAAEAARIWDIADPARPRPLGHAGDSRRVRAAAIFPDGRWLATAGERVEFWEVSATPVRRMHLTAGDGPLFDVALAPDGRTMAVGRLDGTVDLWHTIDPSAPARRASIDAHAGWITSVAFGADGRWLATVSAEHVALWDLRDPTAAVGRIRARLPVTAIAFAPRRGLLAVASLDGSVALLRPTAPGSPERDGRPAWASEPAGSDGDATTWAGAAATDDVAATAEIPVDVEPLASLRPTAPDDAGIELPGRRRPRRRSNGRAVAVGGVAVSLSTLLVFGHQLGLPPALLLVVGVVVMLALVAATAVALAAAVGGTPRARTRSSTGRHGTRGATRRAGARAAEPRPSVEARAGGDTADTNRPLSATGPLTATGPLSATLPLDIVPADFVPVVVDAMDTVAVEDGPAAATATAPVTEPWPPRSAP
jgi:hypothetical protein